MRIKNMELQTERLFLHPLNQGDESFILELLNTDEWIKFIGDKNIYTETEANAYIQKIILSNFNYWVVYLKETDDKIGLVTLNQRDYLEFKDIGFAFLPRFTNKGFAYEATNEILKNVIENLQEIHAITLAENTSSIKLLVKLGLKFEKMIEQNKETLLLYSLKRSMK